MKNINLLNITIRNCTFNGAFISGADNLRISKCDFNENGGNAVPGPKIQHNLLLSHCRQVNISGSRMALLILSLNLLMRAAAVIPSPQPRTIQKTVGLMLLCIIFLDAIMVFAITADAKLAALVIMLVAPASLLRRVIPMS